MFDGVFDALFMPCSISLALPFLCLLQLLDGVILVGSASLDMGSPVLCASASLCLYAVCATQCLCLLVSSSTYLGNPDLRRSRMPSSISTRPIVGVMLYYTTVTYFSPNALALPL